MTTKIIPNAFQVPNWVIDVLGDCLSPKETKVLLFMVRHILGWQDKIESRRAKISLSMFLEGVTYTNAQDEIVTMCGIGGSKCHLIKVLGELKKYGVIQEYISPERLALTERLKTFPPDHPEAHRLQKRLAKIKSQGTEWYLPELHEIDVEGLKRRGSQDKSDQNGSKWYSDDTEAVSSEYTISMPTVPKENQVQSQEVKAIKDSAPSDDSAGGASGVSFLNDTQHTRTESVTQKAVLEQANDHGLQELRSEHKPFPIQGMPLETQKTPPPAAAAQEGTAREPQETPAPVKQKDWEARPWLYSPTPVAVDVYRTLTTRDKNTALFSMICYHLMQSVTSPEQVYNLLAAKPGKRRMEHRLLGMLSTVENRTPESLATFARQYRNTEYGKKALDPAVLIARYVEHLKVNPGLDTPAIAVNDLPWMYQAYFTLAKIAPANRIKFAGKKPEFMLKALETYNSYGGLETQFLSAIPEWREYFSSKQGVN